MDWIRDENNRLIGSVTQKLAFTDGVSDEIYFDLPDDVSSIPNQVYITVSDDNEKYYSVNITEYQTQERTCKFSIINEIDEEIQLKIELIIKLSE